MSSKEVKKVVLVVDCEGEDEIEVVDTKFLACRIEEIEETKTKKKKKKKKRKRKWKRKRKKRKNYNVRHH
jgi:hypothetical protein